MVNWAKISSTRFDGAFKLWTVKFSTPTGEHTVISKHLVQATGIGSQMPHIPAIANQELFGGINIHSSRYKNAKELAQQGVKVSCYIPSTILRVY